jgi:Haem-binding domain
VVTENRPCALVVGGIAILLVAIQLVPVGRVNPPVVATVDAPPAVMAVLRRACFDCHSHETVWPLQSRVAPFSWLIAHDVKEGREELDLSRWSPEERKRAAKGIPEEVEKKDMPPLLYVLAHPEARLTAAERATLADWARGLSAPGP